MSEKTEIAAEAAAVKAYAAAAEAATPQTARAAPVTSQAEAEVEFPSKAKRTAKSEAPAPRPIVEAKAVPAVKLKAAAQKAAPLKPAGKPKIVTAKAPAKANSPKLERAASPKPAAPKISAPKTLFQQFKDTTMNTTEFTTKIKSAVNEAQAKAKEALGKGAATFHEYNEFSKGNVDAVVASGKILAGGLQTLGKVYVEDSKAAFANLTGEVKELASVKSPADFFKLQSELLRRNFGAAVAATSKNSEAVLKLAGEAAAPISARVHLAVEKIKQAA